MKEGDGVSETGGKIRAFVCAAPPAEVLTAIGAFLASLRSFRAFRWVGPEQVHITLKFLGESDAAAIQSLDTNLARMGGVRPFDVGLRGAGAFPNLSRPRVIWLGIDEGAEPLARLASRVDQAAKSASYEPEKRKFQPHLTLGRSRGEPAEVPGLAEALASAPDISWRCDCFILMKSVLTRQGPIYTPIRTYPLG